MTDGSMSWTRAAVKWPGYIGGQANGDRKHGHPEE